MKKISLPIAILGWILTAFGVFATLSCFSIVGNPTAIISGFDYAANNAAMTAAWMIGGRSLGQAIVMVIGLLTGNRKVLMAAFIMRAVTETGDMVSGLVFGTGAPILVVFVLLEIASAVWLGVKAKDE